MVHGMADFGIYTPKTITYNLADLADLAVRLGSVVEYDRRGDVIYIDDFEGSTQRYEEILGAGGSTKLDSTVALSGSQSVKFLTEGAIDNAAGIQYYISPLVSGKHGIKIALSGEYLHLRSNEISIEGEVYSGVDYFYCGVRFNPFAKTIAYYGTDEEYHVFETDFAGTMYPIYLFHNIKLVVDWDTGKYMRLLFDTLSWDLSEYSMYKTAVIAGSSVWAAIEIKAKTAFVETMYGDNFVYTINEP